MDNLLKFKKANAVPLVMQSEAAECGLACLLMVSGYFGKNVSLHDARRDFGASLKGLTVENIVKIADRMGMSSRAMRADVSSLKQVTLPAVLHWDLSHFVVLTKISGGKFFVNDPAKGSRVYTRDEFSDHFTGIVLDFQKSSNFKPEKKVRKAKLSDFWSEMRGLKRSLIQILLLSGLIQIFVIAMPIFQQIVIDDVIISNDADLLKILAIAFVLLGIFETALNFIRAKTIQFLTFKLNYQMTSNLFAHLMKLPVEFFEKRKVGDIVTRFSSLGPIQTIISSSIVSVILDSVLAIVTLTMSFLYSPQLTFYILLFLALNLVITLLVFPYQKKANEKILELSAKEQTTFLENIQAAPTIKIFGKESVRDNVWKNKLADKMNASISLGNFEINLGAVTGVIGTFQSVFIFFIGASLIIAGEMSLGMLIAYQSYSGQFSSKFLAQGKSMNA